MKYLLLVFLAILLFSCQSEDISAQEGFNFRDVATHLDTPWEILWGPDDHIWMTERYGRISRVNPETGDVQELITMVDVFEGGERGLLGMVLHPDFDTNPYVYVAYNTGNDNQSTDVNLARLTYDGEKLVDRQIIISDIQGWSNHNGSRLWILEDNTLLMTVGDAHFSDRAQDNSNINGTIIRINLDGSIPADNPIEDSRIYINGSRNAQGLVVHNGIIYSSEHGPDTDDEVNIIKAGRNYGWPDVKGYCDEASEMSFCEEHNVVEPIAAWTPTLAVCGIDFYDNDLIPEFENSLLVTSLKSQTLVQLKLDASGTEVIDENQFFNGQFGRLRDVCVSPDGRVFIATSTRDGRGSPTEIDDRIIEVTPNINGVDSKDKGGILNVVPNPASMSADIYFGDISHNAKIKIFDMTGRLIIQISEVAKSALNWDLRDDNGNICPNGIYHVVLLDEKIRSEKLLIKR